MSKSPINVLPSDIDGAHYGVCDEREPQRGGCAAISVENLSLRYGAHTAFRNISVRILPCAITAIVGPSGCGKTSFLNCINRMSDLIPSAEVTGSLHLGRLDVLHKHCDLLSLRRRVGMIFQRPTPFPFSIEKNFHLPLKEHGVRCKRTRSERMEEALREVGLWDEVRDRLSSSAATLSGGQQQRLCIARTVALNPEIILMDEPCSSLDPIASAAVENLIASLRGRYTIVIVTHNMQQARRLADEVAFFWLQDGAGALLEHGGVRQVFEEPQHELTAAYVSGLQG